MKGAGTSAADPFKIIQQTSYLYNEPYVYAGRTLVSPALVSGESTAVLVTFGDSLAANAANANYTPTNASKVQNISLQNQGVYLAQDPLLGPTDNAAASAYGNWIHRLADKLITGGKFQRVIIMPIAMGGSTSEMWAAGGMHSYRFGIAYRRLAAAGLANVQTLILSSLGGGDKSDGFNEARSTAGFYGTIAAIRAAGWATTPVFLARSSFKDLVGSTAVRNAIATVTAASPNVFVGADTDTLDGTNRYDTNHWNATGANACANLWQTILNAYLP